MKQEIPPIQLVDGCLFVSSSFLDTVQRCPTEGRYYKLHERVLDHASEALSFGSILHESLELRARLLESGLTGAERTSILNTHLEESFGTGDALNVHVDPGTSTSTSTGTDPADPLIGDPKTGWRTLNLAQQILQEHDQRFDLRSYELFQYNDPKTCDHCFGTGFKHLKNEPTSAKCYWCNGRGTYRIMVEVPFIFKLCDVSISEKLRSTLIADLVKSQHRCVIDHIIDLYNKEINYNTANAPRHASLDKDIACYADQDQFAPRGAQRPRPSIAGSDLDLDQLIIYNKDETKPPHWTARLKLNQLIDLTTKVDNSPIADDLKYNLISQFNLKLIDLLSKRSIPVYQHGFLDLPIKSNDQIYILDYKTTSMLGPGFFDEKKVSMQQKGYCFGFQTLTNQKVSGFIVRAIRTLRMPDKVANGKMVMRGKNAGTVVTQEKWWNDSFQEERFILGDDELVEWKENATALVHEFLNYYADQYFPMRPLNCAGKYGRCQYFEVCTTFPQSDRIHILNSGLFKKKEGRIAKPK